MTKAHAEQVSHHAICAGRLGRYRYRCERCGFTASTCLAAVEHTCPARSTEGVYQPGPMDIIEECYAEALGGWVLHGRVLDDPPSGPRWGTP